MMVSFDDPVLGDAAAELQSLGTNFACRILLYLQKVDSKQINSAHLKPFYTYLGVEMFLASTGNNLAIFAVELDPVGDLTITLMFAGQHGVAKQYGTFYWAGSNYGELASGILAARAAIWFV
jgi:hypothetical protein